MPRRFREHDLRHVTDLSGVWDFEFLGNITDESVDLRKLDYPDRMAVPGCFDATPAYAGQRGLAAYRTWINLDDSSLHRLVFDAVQHTCRIFLDGTPLGEHCGGFTRFGVELKGWVPGAHELVVLVDNRIDPQRCPLHHDHFDWYQYGGISRGVALHQLGEVWIDDLRVETLKIDPVTLRVTIWYKAVRPQKRERMVIRWDETVVLDTWVDLAETPGEITRELELGAASLWSPDSPALHLLHLTLGADDCRERVGVRQIRVEGRQVLINNRPVRLLGFNRHESHPLFGHSQPEALLVSDIQLLRDLGCNFVRGSHYPQDPLFLDLCDEAGICVWSEAIGWQHTAEHLGDAVFVNAQLTHLREMMSTTANHASVIFWGILNESHSHDERCRPAYRDLLRELRSLDPTRPVTYASNHPYNDLCFDLVDVIAINLYPGWYIGELADLPGMLDATLAHIDSGAWADRPVILSEIGAGAIPGWRDGHQGLWSEQYQARLLEMVIRHLFVDGGRVCGLGIWLFSDFRTPASVMRPRGFNNKGVLDEYRRPKQAYGAVRRLFRQLREAGIH